MPRGPTLYSLPPGTTPQIPGETIPSAIFNAFADDVANTFNTVQPISYGGTGAATAVGAADNLSPAYVNVASGATTNIGSASSPNVNITGTTGITAFDTAPAGAKRLVKFAGALTITHDATSMILPDAVNMGVEAGDTAIFVSEGSGNWRCVMHQRANTLRTPVASTSGTSISFTGIPAGIKRVKVMLTDVSTDGSSNIILQLGDSGGFETSGYLSSASSIATAVGTTAFTTGIGVIQSIVAGTAFGGCVTLDLLDPSTNTWVASGVIARTTAAVTDVTSGAKSLSAVLDRIRVTTVGGTDTFDAGKINISYE